MSFISKNYKVERVITNTTFIDITDFVVSLDDFVLQSTGKIATAKLTLNSEFGNFITDDNGGTTPILDQFDLMRITVIGDDGITIQRRVFEITTDLSQLAGKSSYLLPLEMEGRERNLAGVPFGGFFRTATHSDIINQIGSAYNAQKGTAQPLFGSEISSPIIPDFNPNIWDFTQVDNCFDALLEVVGNLDLPVSAGGAGNRYAIVYDDQYIGDVLQDNILIFKVLIQGTTNNAPFPILEQNNEHPIIKIARIKNPSTGTVVIARGRPKTAIQPQNYTKFTSLLEFYRNIKLWDSTIIYPENSYVAWESNVGGWSQRWLANTDTTAGAEPGVSSDWTAIDVGDYIGDLQYSPWTVDKATVIQNGFANPTGGFDPDTLGSIAIPDHNMVINDVEGTGNDTIGTYRNWVYFRTNSVDVSDLNSIQKSYLYDLTSGLFAFYRGFTVLVDPNVGTLQPPFDGNDPNGIPYENNMAVFSPPANFGLESDSTDQTSWFVVRDVQEFDQCAVYAEGLVYEYNVNFASVDNRVYPGGDRRRGGAGETFQWRSIASQFLGNECFHTPISVENVQGLIASNLTDGEPLNDPSDDPYNDNSGLEIIFGYDQAIETPTEQNVWFDMIKTIVVGSAVSTLLVGLASNVFTTFTTPNYTNMGWWFAWPSPYPFSTFNGILENIGELYGGDMTSLNNHRYFDMFNIQYTTTGNQGWTHSDSSDLSEITGVEFLFNFDITISNTRIPFTGDVPFSYWCMDSNGTLWKSAKIMYRHLGETQQLKIEFGDLNPVFRGRTPLGIDNVLENIIVGEIEVNEIFFKDKIIMQGFQCETPYDEFGRYSPNLWEQIVKPTFFNVFSGGTGDVRFTGVLDAFGFTKTPIAISQSTTLSLERAIVTQFEDFQNIVNIEQLQRYADSARETEEFQYEQYTVSQGGIADLELEDTVTLHDQYLINDSDEGPNTRNVAVRELHYSVPKEGGLIRKMVGVKIIDTGVV